jgi:hypothetical protein
MESKVKTLRAICWIGAMGDLVWVFGLKIVLFSMLGYGLFVARQIAAQRAIAEAG